METYEKIGMKLMRIEYSKTFLKIMTNGLLFNDFLNNFKINYFLKSFFKQVFT